MIVESFEVSIVFRLVSGSIVRPVSCIYLLPCQYKYLYISTHSGFMITYNDDSRFDPESNQNRNPNCYSACSIIKQQNGLSDMKNACNSCRAVQIHRMTLKFRAARSLRIPPMHKVSFLKIIKK